MNTALMDVELQAIFTCIHEIVAAPHLPAALKRGMCRTSLESGDPAAAAAVVCGLLSAADDARAARDLLATCEVRPEVVLCALADTGDALAQRWSVLMEALLAEVAGLAPA